MCTYQAKPRPLIKNSNLPTAWPISSNWVNSWHGMPSTAKNPAVVTSVKSTKPKKAKPNAMTKTSATLLVGNTRAMTAYRNSTEKR